MEVLCPSCASSHRSEDYPGAFDILCGCGYLILNPDLGVEANDYNEINFEGPPAIDQTKDNIVKVINETAEQDQNLFMLSDIEQNYSADKLTPPEELPEGMLYDPAEVPQEQVSEPSAPNESTLSRIFVARVQRASIGQILGPDYDLEFSELEPNARLKARERIEKFLQDHKWLKEEMERRSFVIEDAFQTERLSIIPEALAIEMYIACLEQGGKCLFMRHGFREAI